MLQPSLSLESLSVRKPFFRNFIDPVPLNHQLRIPPDQVPEVSCSNGKADTIQPEAAEDQDEDHEFVTTPELTQEMNIMLIVFFKNVCLAALTRGCDDEQCSHSHELPDHFHLKRQLLNNSLKDLESVYDFVLKLPRQRRIRFFPAFAGVFAKFQQMSMMKRLIRDYQKIDTADGFDYILDALVRNGCSKHTAVKFLIDHHIDSPEARKKIFGIIGNTGQDFVKFLDYVHKVQQQDSSAN